jgi:sigma-B regulation protein RsbU (phosphoserine phosphatase)
VADAVSRMNRELARDNERAMFVTVFAARLDLATGELEYVNAGHNPTYRLAAGGAVATLPGPVDPALGAVEEHAYRSSRLRLAPRDAVLLYTDGVVEARSAGAEAIETLGLAPGKGPSARGPAAAARGATAEEFHTLRLESYLAGCRDAPAERIVSGLLERLDEFVGEAPQYDDITVVALRWLGAS